MTHQQLATARPDPDPVAASPRAGFRRGRALVFGVLVVALVLRIFHLDFQNLWADEGISAHFASGSVAESLTKVTQYDISPPLYILILNGWTDWFGSSDYSLRMPSALFSFATLILLWRIAATLFDRRAATYSLLLATFSLHSIYYGQEARPYALLGLLATASMLVYLNLLRRPGWTWIALLALVNASMLYVNYFGLFVIAAQLGHILTSYLDSGPIQLSADRYPDPRRGRLRSLLLVNLISLLLFLPWIGQCLRNVDRFQKESYLEVPGFEKLLLAFATILSNWAYGWLPLYLTAGIILALVIVATLSIFASTRTVIAWLWSPRDADQERRQARSAQLLVLWLLLPVLLSWSVSQLGIRVFDVKVLSVAFPALAILLGYCLTRIRWQALALGLLVLLVVDSVQHYRRNYYQPHKPRYRQAMDYLARQPDDTRLVVCGPEYCGLAAHQYVTAGSNKVVALSEAIASQSFWFLEIKQGDPSRFRYLRRLGYRGVERARFPKIKVWYWTR